MNRVYSSANDLPVIIEDILLVGGTELHIVPYRFKDSTAFVGATMEVSDYIILYRPKPNDSHRHSFLAST